MEGDGTELMLDKEKFTEEACLVSTSPPVSFVLKAGKIDNQSNKHITLSPITVTQSSTKKSHTSTDIKVTLENESVWNRFHSLGTEMILTKQGRRMFPCCRFRLSGLDLQRKYFLVMDIIPLDHFTYRWNGTSWEPLAVDKLQVPGQICVHPESPALGQLWMESPVSFYKVKLTNDTTDQEGCVILRPMCRYQPRLRIVPFDPDSERIIALDSPNVEIFSFPQTEFYAVTSYQNPQITQLKIDCNPFAMAFREDGQSLCLAQDKLKPCSSVNTLFRSPLVHLAQKISVKLKEDAVQSTASNCIPDKKTSGLYSGTDSLEEGDGIFTKMRNDISCQNTDYSEDNEESKTVVNKYPLEPVQHDYMAPLEFEPNEIVSLKEPMPCTEEPVPPISSTENSEQSSEAFEDDISSHSVQTHRDVKSAIVSLPRPQFLNASPVNERNPDHLFRCRPNQRSRKAKSKCWSKVKYKKPVPAVVTQNTPLHPDLEDVEGMLFVSFVAKEALNIHAENVKESETSLTPPSSTHEQSENHKAEAVSLSVVEQIAKSEKLLLLHLKQQKHRQVIHPCLQDVGMKLSLLDPKLPIDLQYLGVHLPLPSPILEGLDDRNLMSRSSSPDAAGVFVSRTGKTNDPTKIKGWKDKFKTSAVQGVPETLKNSSAFCSEMLDAYLENEAQQISDRVAVFSKCSASPVSYQLPSKSSSYVVTLDSLLKTRSVSSSKVYSKTMDEILPKSQHRGSPSTAIPLSSAGFQHTLRENKEKERNIASSAKAYQHAGSTLQASKAMRFVSRTGSKKQLGKSLQTWNSSAETTSHISSLHSPMIPIKVRNKMLLHGMEKEAIFHGKVRTHITTKRAKFALTSLLNFKKKDKRPTFSLHLKNENACPEAFCHLGCICDSLKRESRGPTHCRRVECMFNCTCFKHKVLLLRPKKETPAVRRGRKRSVLAFPISDPQRKARPPPAPSMNTLWKRKTGEHDPEPIFIPVPPISSKNVSYLRTGVKHSFNQVLEEDKDPVYLYFESMMTCARVREYNSNPPPQIHMFPTKKEMKEYEFNELGDAGEAPFSQKIPDPNPTEMPINPLESEGTKLLEILSECNWEPHRSFVLSTLFRRMSSDLLSEPFCLGMYKIQLLSTTIKGVGRSSTVTYKVCISRADEKEMTEGLQAPVKKSVKKQSLKGVETKVSKTCKTQAQKATADTEPGRKSSTLVEKQQINPLSNRVLRPLPFLNAAAPLGYLKANIRKPGSPNHGLIKVNGKLYSKAKLQLGQLGALHPVNRIAAFVTGRILPTLQNQAKTVGDIIKGCPSKAPVVPKSITTVSTVSNLAVANVANIKAASKNRSNISPTNAVSNTVDPPPGTTPIVPNGTRFVLVPVTPSNCTAAPQAQTVPSSTLPPGQQVVLQPAPGMLGSNFLCQYNGQMIQLKPINIGPLHQPPCSVNEGRTSQVMPTAYNTGLPKDTKSHQGPLTSTPLPKMLPKPFPVSTHKVHSLSAKSGINIARGMSAFNLQSSFTGKTGTFSFRICPPTADRRSVGAEHGGKPPGPSNSSIVALPGGFTLLKLFNSTVPAVHANNISAASHPGEISQNYETVTKSLVQSCTPSLGQNCQVSETIVNNVEASYCNSSQGATDGLNQSRDDPPFKDEPGNTVAQSSNDWIPEGAVMVHKSDVSEQEHKYMDDWPPNRAERILWVDSADEENLDVVDEIPATKEAAIESKTTTIAVDVAANISKQVPPPFVANTKPSQISFGSSGINEQLMIDKDGSSIVKTESYNKLTAINMAGNESYIKDQDPLGKDFILDTSKKHNSNQKEGNTFLDQVPNREQRLDSANNNDISIKIESCSDSPKPDPCSMQDDVAKKHIGPENILLIDNKEEPSSNQMVTEFSQDLSKQGLGSENDSHILNNNEFSNEPANPNTTALLQVEDIQENVEIAGNASSSVLDAQTFVNSTPTVHLPNPAILSQKSGLKNVSPLPQSMTESFPELPDSFVNLSHNCTDKSQIVQQDCDDDEVIVDVVNLSGDEGPSVDFNRDEDSSSDDSDSSSSDDEDSCNDSTSDSETTDDTGDTSNEDDDVESFEDSGGKTLKKMLQVQCRHKHNLNRAADWKQKDFTSLSKSGYLPTHELDKRLSHTEKERARRDEMRQSFAALKKALNVEEQVKLYNHDILNQARLMIWALKDRSQYLEKRKKSLQQKQSVFLSKITELTERTEAKDNAGSNGQNTLQTSVPRNSENTSWLDGDCKRLSPRFGCWKAPNYIRQRSKKALCKPSITTTVALDKSLDSQSSPDSLSNHAVSGSLIKSEDLVRTLIAQNPTILPSVCKTPEPLNSLPTDHKPTEKQTLPKIALQSFEKTGIMISKLNSSEVANPAELLMMNGDHLDQQEQNKEVDKCNASESNQVVKEFVSEPSNKESPAPSSAVTGNDVKNNTLSELEKDKQASVAVVKEKRVRKKRAKSDVVIEEALSNPDILGPRQLRRRPPEVAGGATRGGTAKKRRRRII